MEEKKGNTKIIINPMDKNDKSEEEDQNWSFEVDKKKLSSAKRRKSKIPRAKNILSDNRKLALDNKEKVKRTARSKFYEKEGTHDIEYPSPLVRLKACIIDLVLLGMIWYICTFIAGYFENFILDIEELILKSGVINSVAGMLDFSVISKSVNQTVDYLINEDGLYYAIETIIALFLTLIGYIAFFIIPLPMTGRTVGKRIAKIRVDHVFGGFITYGQAFKRETIGKLINLISLIGIWKFFRHKKGITLHDQMCDSIVIVDDTLKSKDDD